MYINAVKTTKAPIPDQSLRSEDSTLQKKKKIRIDWAVAYISYTFGDFMKSY